VADPEGKRTTMASNKYEEITQAAVRLFEKKGYHSTTIQEISDSAGVSKGAIFHYFPNKGEILFEIHDSFIDIILNQGKQVLNRDDLNNSQKLSQLIIDLVQLIADFKPYVVVFFQEYKYIGEDRLVSIKEKRDGYESFFRAVVEQGVRSGEFRQDLDVDIIVKSIFGMCDWTYQWMKTDGKYTPLEIGQMFRRILLDGLKGNN